MAGIAITNKDTLKQIFDKVSRVYYFATPNVALSAQTAAIEFPVLEDGVLLIAQAIDTQPHYQYNLEVR